MPVPDGEVARWIRLATVCWGGYLGNMLFFMVWYLWDPMTLAFLGAILSLSLGCLQRADGE